MQDRKRFLLLVMGGGAALAVISLSLQFLNLIPSAPSAPSVPSVEERPLQLSDGGVRSALPKTRKRVFLAPPTATPDPLSEAYGYCNPPDRPEPAWEGHSPADYQLISVQVMIRHGDRYPLYSIPKTRRPPIDCTLSPSRTPSHPLLQAFVGHMGQGRRGRWDPPLASVPRVPNHSSCETGELTQTGVVQHLRNGQLLHHAYKVHGVLPSDWSSGQLWVESTGRGRTVQSALALLYGFLPDFNWTGVVVRHQWNTLFCGSSCDCPARNRHLEEEQRRQYRLRVADAELERTYADMARTLGLPPRQLRAANPIDSLLCLLCHNLSFPCVPAGGAGAGGCLTMSQFAVIRRQQLDDELDRRRAGLYRQYAVLAMFPFLNRMAARMERAAAGGAGQELFALSSAHDVTVAPLLSALGLEEARFPRFAARVVFELWRSPAPPAAPDKAARNGELFVRVLYDGQDVTFHTAFCRAHARRARRPLCPLVNFLRFVRRDMFRAVGATSYRQACYKLPV